MASLSAKLVLVALAVLTKSASCQYYGQQFPVCPFCNDTVCEYLATSCNPLTSNNLVGCENYVNSHCANFGVDETGCSCCDYSNAPTVACFDNDARCGEGVNKWFCQETETACGDIADKCELRTFGPYHWREINEVSNYDLLNGWTVRHGTDIVNGDVLGANLAPSFWQDDYFTHVQGTLNVGNEQGIFVLPVTFRPARNTSFICNSAVDDIHNLTLPILVTVLTDGMVFVDSNETLHGITSLQLKMIFTYNDTLKPLWNSLLHAVSDGTVIQSVPSYYKDPLTGWVYFRGHLQRTCNDDACVVMSGLADIVPATMGSGQAFVQLLDTDGNGRFVNFTSDGQVLVSGSSTDTETNIYLDGIVLMEENVDLYNSDDVGLDAVGASSAWPTVDGVQSQRLWTDVVQLSGVATPTNFSFHGAYVMTLQEAFRPTYHTKQLVPCKISPVVLTCAVVVEADGDVLLYTPFENPPYSFTPDSDGHWVSLSGVRFGGYVYNVQVHLEGTSEIELVGSSYIQIGV